MKLSPLGGLTRPSVATVRPLAAAAVARLARAGGVDGVGVLNTGRFVGPGAGGGGGCGDAGAGNCEEARGNNAGAAVNADWVLPIRWGEAAISDRLPSSRTLWRVATDR